MLIHFLAVTIVMWPTVALASEHGATRTDTICYDAKDQIALPCLSLLTGTNRGTITELGDSQPRTSFCLEHMKAAMRAVEPFLETIQRQRGGITSSVYDTCAESRLCVAKREVAQAQAEVARLERLEQALAFWKDTQICWEEHR